MGDGEGLSIYTTQSIATERAFIATSGYLQASDKRIKENIVDISDGYALDTLRLLKPKQYTYIDTVKRGFEPVWGFIAQEVEEIMPEAVNTKDHFIPNIYKIAKYNDKIITLNETTEYTPVQGDIIMIYDENDVLTETTILEVYSDVSFKIEDEILTENVFIYGSKVDDFKTLIKEMFHPICVSSIQEHNKIINEQQEKINELEAKINMLMEHLNLS